MNIRTLVGALAALTIILAACGGDATPVAAPAISPAAEVPVVAAPATIDVKTGVSELGDVLTGPQGLTLYGFTNDVDAISTCYGTCADAWPPVIVNVDFQAGPGLDFGIFATTVREDGRLQLVAGKWPLYYFAGDAAPGGLNGQGSGGVWFAVDTDGILIEEAAADAPAPTPTDPTVGAVVADVGEVLADVDGLTLYGFLNDTDGTPTCNDACADAWPPLLVANGELPTGLDPEVFSIEARSDGSMQLKAGNWPLYRFAGDTISGDINGQASGRVWFAAATDGSLIGSPTTASDQATGTASDY